jgi:hypothetical protein
MTAKPDIHPLARAHLRELRERWSVEPTLEESLWIVRLCERVVNPAAGERLDLVGVPERCGSSDEWLWPITIGAAVWFQDLASGWWRGDGERLFWALAFCLAHGRDKATLTACRTREAAAGMIREWSLSLCCTRAELEAAVDAVLPPPPGAAAAPGRTDWACVAGEIESVTGIPCEHWLWEVSREATLGAWLRARRVLAAMGGCGPGAAPRGAEDAALAELAEAKRAIIAAHAAGGAA